MAWCGFNIQKKIKLLLLPANTSSQADAMVEMIIRGLSDGNAVLCIDQQKRFIEKVQLEAGTQGDKGPVIALVF